MPPPLAELPPFLRHALTERGIHEFGSLAGQQALGTPWSSQAICHLSQIQALMLLQQTLSTEPSSSPCFGLFILFCETGSRYRAQADLKLEILLLQPAECWEYNSACPSPASDSSFCLNLPRLDGEI